ncbi:MAG: UDP-glucose 4-epimerase GalE [Patescibacteria group bacterium]|jgi:UDP-glucose 4-epimerase|nr:UDP-glucose 4-epimerase GalE [Patescibacteria group bacterium]
MPKFKKILVTGGAGFIGSHVVNDLIHAQYKVVVLDNLSTGYKKLISPRAEFIKGDLRQIKFIKKALEGCEAVIHLAAHSVVPYSVKRPRFTIEQNLAGGANLLEACRKQKIKKLIFSSTASIYGEPDNVPIKEDDAKYPNHAYGASKLAFEKLLSAYYQSYNLNSIALRYFNAYGPNEMHCPETHAIPLFIQAILKQEPIQIYGDGLQIRDYVYVKDISKAHVLVLESDIKFDYFNIGSQKGTSVLNLVKTIFKVMGVETKIKYLPHRDGDVQQLIADTHKIKKVLGWQPDYTLEAGLNETADWFSQKLKI